MAIPSVSETPWISIAVGAIWIRFLALAVKGGRNCRYKGKNEVKEQREKREFDSIDLIWL